MAVYPYALNMSKFQQSFLFRACAVSIIQKYTLKHVFLSLHKAQSFQNLNYSEHMRFHFSSMKSVCCPEIRDENVQE